MPTLKPRAVVVTRETDYDRLLAVHATREQARFFLRSRGLDLNEVVARHETFVAAVRDVRASIPAEWRSARVERADLDRFMFSPEDIVIAVGQDGLVANLAKYLRGQPVLGVNPDPATNEGVLVSLDVPQTGRLVLAAAEGAASIERRTMAMARLDDGQTLTALNEIFVGHRSHQSARYVITHGEDSERQSSSGVIVATGTGATGWARSIMQASGRKVAVSPVDRRLAFFVREPWPSVATGDRIAFGPVPEGARLTVRSNMNDGGVIFADGIEQDHLDFGWGRAVEVSVAPATLNLVRAD